MNAPTYTMKMFLRSILAILLLTSVVTAVVAKDKKPNVIIVMTDDQGYGDLSCHGNPILKTPNLENCGGRFMVRAVRF